MKAIVVENFVPDPAQLKPRDVPNPAPSDGQYLIRVSHCSPQHADILHAQGRHQNNNVKHGWCHPPFILGFDFAGDVQSTPADGSGRLKRGDRVFGAFIGAFAEYISVPERSIRKAPDGLSSDTLCAMSGQAVSYSSVVHIAKVQPGETVLVSGASGGLGSVCCMVAKAVGARVVALAGDEDKAQLMRQGMIADLVLVMKDDWMERVLDYTGQEGVDVFLDNTGMVNNGIRCVAYSGRIVILGFAARKGVMEEVKMNKLLLKSISVTGYRFGESGRRHPQLMEEIWKGYLEMLRSGKLKPLLYGKYNGLEDVGRALGDLAARKVCGKIVVKVADAAEISKL